MRNAQCTSRKAEEISAYVQPHGWLPDKSTCADDESFSWKIFVQKIKIKKYVKNAFFRNFLKLRTIDV